MIEVKDIFVYLKDFEFYYVFIVIDREISVCIIDLGKDLVKEGYYYYRQIGDIEEVIVIIEGVVVGIENKIGFLVLKVEIEKVGIIVFV